MAPSNAALVGGVVAFFLSATFVRLESPFDPVVWEHVSYVGGGEEGKKSFFPLLACSL